MGKDIFKISSYQLMCHDLTYKIFPESKNIPKRHLHSKPIFPGLVSKPPRFRIQGGIECA